MWRVSCIFLLLLPGHVHAQDSSDLQVTYDLALAGVVSGYKTIRIEAGATLTIAPSTELSFLPGGGIVGPGNLRILGTSNGPVLLHGVTWQGISVQGTVEIAWTSVVGAEGPFSFSGGRINLTHVLLQDVPDSRIFLSSQQREDILVNGLAIRWDTLTTGQVGVILGGNLERVEINSLRVPSSKLLGNREIVSILSSYSFMQLSDALTYDGCRFKLEFSVGIVWRAFRVDPACLPVEPSTLFIPGYAASINQPVLLNPQPSGPVRAGWSFVPYITKSYNHFLTEAQARGVKVAVAYYDWRQRLPRIVQDYLIPAIEDLKRRDGVDRVNLVAHSFGGIVARAYIQSPLYRNDVAGFVELGTPNKGSVKAYAPWEAAVFSDDWSPLIHLVRYYHYKKQDSIHSDLEALHTFIPSGQALLPLGPILQRASGVREPLRFRENLELMELENSAHTLRERVSTLFTVAGTGPLTHNLLRVGEVRPRATYWQDGELLPGGELSTQVGDGTVSVVSASLPSISQVLFPASHMDLPAVAADYVLNRLYPHRPRPPDPPLKGADRSTAHILWFVFDCPVSVTITTPSGKSIHSETGSTDTATVYADPEAIWVLTPEEVGTYAIAIKALADTEVRWWG